MHKSRRETTHRGSVSCGLIALFLSLISQDARSQTLPSASASWNTFVCLPGPSGCGTSLRIPFGIALRPSATKLELISASPDETFPEPRVQPESAVSPGNATNPAAPIPGRPSQANVPPPYDFDADVEREASAKTSHQASTYIPLDHWSYPVFDRLGALGYLPSGTFLTRPWTRLEAARLLAEAHIFVTDGDDLTMSSLAELDREFAPETHVIDGGRNVAASLDNSYERFTGIAGTPIRDGYHFASTITNDGGRPFGKGANSITGASVLAQAGPFAVYANGEYQYASSIPAYSQTAQQTIAAADGLPFGWDLRSGNTSRPRPVEAYVSAKLADWQLNFGYQALWWGPDRSTSLMLSNNAEALPMLRLDRVKPVKMPGPLSLLGPVHFDLFLARQGGIHYLYLGVLPNFVFYGSADKALTPPPYIWGISASIKPTENFELAFSHTTIFAGYGRPLTFGTFYHTLSTTGNAQLLDPGKRVTEISFSYRPPSLRNKVEVYTEAMAWDDPLQGKFVARYAMDPGIYLPRIPKLSRLDLRLEGAYTDLPKLAEQGYFYANARYRQGYTNDGQILGSWVGRQGIGGQATSNYWFSPQRKLTFSYRKMVEDTSILEGGHISDFSAGAVWTIHSAIELSANGKYEQWQFPLLGTASRSNFASTFQVRFFSKSGLNRR